MADEIVETVVVGDTEPAVAETVIAGLEALDFESTATRNARKVLEAAKERTAKRLAVLTEKLSASEKSDKAHKTEVSRLAKRLMRDGLSAEAVSAAIARDYKRSRKVAVVVAEKAPRGSHKLDDANKTAIGAFIAAHPDGITAKAIWTEFAGLDKMGVSMAVKRLVEAGTVRAVGNTRKRVYFPAV